MKFNLSSEKFCKSCNLCGILIFYNVLWCTGSFSCHYPHVKKRIIGKLVLLLRQLTMIIEYNCKLKVVPGEKLPQSRTNQNASFGFAWYHFTVTHFSLPLL